MNHYNIAGYFDYAAATPIDPLVLKAMSPYFSENFYNPSAIYQPAREVKSALKAARATCASAIGAKPVEIIFTAGGTEANNLAVHGVMGNHPGSNMIISAVEHPSIYEVAKAYEHNICPVNPSGLIIIEKLKALIDEKTVLVSVILANNEIGTLQPLKDIAQYLEMVRKERIKKGNKLPIYLHTDASQATNFIDLQVGRMGIDLMTVNGGKIYGPKQSGLLYVKTGLVLKPLIVGGGQEKSLRSGTENVAGIIGLSKALDLAQQNSKQNAIETRELMGTFIKLIKTTFGNAVINGSNKHRLPNNLNVTFPGQDNERLIMLLDDQGYCVASGSACSASNEEPSHVLRAIGLTDEDIYSSIRFSIGKYTTPQSIEQLVTELKKIIG